MAYTQTPGRGNGPKTGAGLPGILNNGSANSTQPGNPQGYNPATSPLDNTVSKGGYEKTLDKVGNTLILRGGDKKEISRAQIGTKQEEAMRKEYEAKKSFTENARKENANFLTAREKIGKTVK